MRLALFCSLILIGLSVAPTSGATTAQSPMVARGQYLVRYGACNDCHTPGWRETFGHVPVKNWMVGSSIGFRGPWGTVYPANVRKRFFEITEDQWLDMVRTRAGPPPMVWHDLRVLTQYDQRSIYRFVRSLGNAGGQTLQDVSPDLEPKTPYFTIVQPK